MISRLLIMALILGITLSSGWIPCTDADDSAELLEYKIKTAFLFNFAKFIDWPANSFNSDTNEFTIGIIAPPKLASATKILRNKTVKGAPVKIITFESAEELQPCHILFLAENDSKLIADVINKFKNSPVLTVADVSGFASQGGVINFIKVDNTIRFEINPEAAQKKDLKISSKLLSLARIVETENSKGVGE